MYKVKGKVVPVAPHFADIWESGVIAPQIESH